MSWAVQSSYRHRHLQRKRKVAVAASPWKCKVRSLSAQESGNKVDPMANHRFSSVSEEEKPCCGISRKAQICLCVLFILLIVVGIAVPVGILMWRQPPKHKEWKGPGTTAHFYEILLGRCYTYTQVVRPELRHTDCQKIGKAFTSAFLSKDPCGSTEQDYRPLMELTTQIVPCDKTVFWSKSSELAHDYTRVQRDMYTLEDTLLGYMADGLKWCGDTSSSEMNYQSCPHWREDCSNNSVSVFWNTVSKRFAEDACGVVHVVLNGSISNTFDEKSTFGRVEVFNLHPEKVHTLKAWVMHNIESVPSDSCSSSSVNNLKQILKTRNIIFICQNNYRPVRLLQCVKNPEHSSCKYNL